MTPSSDHQTRTPSPVPSPPIPTAPGPRATALQRLYDDAVSHILKTCSYENFSSCFPTPSARVPASMAQLHAQFTAKLGESMRREFSGIVEERGVVGSLNELDALIEEARGRKEKSVDGEAVPPHTLPAANLYQAHLTPLLIQPLNQMREQQTSLENENIELLQRVQDQRREIESLVTGLEAAVGDLEASVKILQEGGGGSAKEEELRNLVRSAEGEMRGGG